MEGGVDVMVVVDMFIRFLSFLAISFLFLRFYRQNVNKKIINIIVLVLHIITLGLFFTNNLNLSYTLFDIIWWSMTSIGIICCVNLLKEKEKLRFFLVPTTTIFILFIVPMMLLDKM